MEVKKNNGMCITGFVFGLLSIFFYSLIPFLPIFAIIFSLIGLAKIKISNQGGKGLAIVGLVVGIIWTIRLALTIYLVGVGML